MKKILVIMQAVILVVSLSSCERFLSYPPQGAASEENLNNPEGAEKLVIAAYASLGNDHWHEPYTTLWPYGNVRAGDAYKGGLGAADQGEYHQYEVFSTIVTDMDKANRIWSRLFLGIQRANSALGVIAAIPDDAYPEKQERIAEMHFLRGHFSFILKMLFKQIPIIREGLTSDEINLVSNVEYSNDEQWSKIGEDFEFAIANLPSERTDRGRPNTTVAKAYLAKVRLYQAYEQDEQNNVININQTRLEEVIRLVDEVINSGEFGLSEDYAMNYLWEYDNGIESIFAVQRSKDDGSPIGRVDMSTALNYPMYPGYGCCSFHRPTQNLVNAFQTNGNGLPNFDGFNQTILRAAQDFIDHSVDPRLDHTVGIPTHPYKYQQDVIYSAEQFTREPATYGPYSTMKEVQQLDCPCLTTAKTYAYPTSSKNNDVIKYSDILLWKAEALIELGRQEAALPLINAIRIRAQNSTGRLTFADGTPVANYHIESYQPGSNIEWNQENARKALRWERRLEFALEGIRFFDLVRWGIASETLNTYFETEKTRVPHLDAAHFTKNRDEYLPIPERQIQYSKGIYEQNYGWN